jgi:hypothetical protein
MSFVNIQPAMQGNYIAYSLQDTYTPTANYAVANSSTTVTGARSETMATITESNKQQPRTSTKHGIKHPYNTWMPVSISQPLQNKKSPHIAL